MTSSDSDWQARASRLCPLLAHCSRGKDAGENQILSMLFEYLPAAAGFAVEFGQPVIGTGTVAQLVKSRRWGALYMDPRAVSLVDVRGTPPGPVLTLAREIVTPSNINALFRRFGVPEQLDCLVIDIDGNDYHVWKALDERYRPSLVVIEFNSNVPAGIAASISADDDWRYARNKNYGASLEAMCALAERKGYRLIHVHGPWNLYFLRKDLEIPGEWLVKPDLDEQEFALLTDVDGFYDALCEPGTRPSWHQTPPPDVSQPPWEVIPPPFEVERLHLGALSLDVLSGNADAQWYRQRKAYEEMASPLYRLLARAGFENFVDVGANIGFISVLAHFGAPDMKLIAIEADPRLAHLVRSNLARHGAVDAVVVNAIVGSSDGPGADFGLNPSSTLDNRVHSPRWPHIRVPMRRLDGIVRAHARPGRTFFKIDTQGFELQVLRGLEPLLRSSSQWLLKMEFAPHWLRSQGADPMTVLDHLQTRYEFAEWPERLPFGVDSLDEMPTVQIGIGQHAEFLQHVSSLNRDGLGWVDLLVRPRAQV